MTSQARHQESGFMYLEVLVSLTLMAVALLATAPMMILSARENASASDMTFATTLAHDKAEELKRARLDQFVSGTDMIRQRGMFFDRVWTIQANTPHPGMHTAVVSVTPRRRNAFGNNRVATIRMYRVF